MAKREKIICPECGTELRHHAEKIDYSQSPDDAGGFDAGCGGVLEEIHSCPACGKTETRRVE